MVAQMIANFFFGVGSMIIFGMCTTMLTEFMPKKASHGIAVNNFIRNIFATISGIIAEPMIKAIGNGWSFTIWAIVVAISGPIIIILMKRCGDHWRIKMERELNKEDT
jgi:MFS family permease